MEEEEDKNSTVQSRLKSNRLAVIIGVDRFQDTTIPSLKGSINDAQEISDILSKSESFDKVTLLLGEQATSINIRLAISDAFWQPESYDMVLLYYSGLGIIDGYGNGFIIAYDTERERPTIAGIPMREVIDMASKAIEKQNIVMVFDCSHSRLFTEGARSRRGLYVLASGTEDEIVRETTFTHHGTVHSHGIFSYYLIEGLAGSASDQSTGDISLAGLYEFVERKMAESGSKQELSLTASGRMDNVIIAKSPRRISEEKVVQNTEVQNKSEAKVASDKKSETKQQYSIKFGPMVQKYLASISNDQSISATFIANKIIKHRGNKTSRIHLKEEGSDERKTLSQWKAEIISLYDSSRVRNINEGMLILGLSLLDPNIEVQLRSEDFLSDLIQEIEEQPVRSLLSSSGRIRWDKIFLASENAVPSHTDNPTVIDHLGRKVFAEVLADRLVRIRNDEARDLEKQKNGKLKESLQKVGGGFLLNIHGSWGSGKTSLLNFLRDELLKKKNPEWIVVEFNAWQNQQSGPPWWSLMNTVFEQSFKRLRDLGSRRRALGLWIWEHLWRSWIKRSNFFLILMISSAIIGMLILSNTVDVNRLFPRGNVTIVTGQHVILNESNVQTKSDSNKNSPNAIDLINDKFSG